MNKLILLFTTILLLLLVTICSGKPISTINDLPSKAQIEQFYNAHSEYKIEYEYLKLKNGGKQQLLKSNKLGNGETVSENCTNAMNELLDVGNPNSNIMMAFYSGIGFNELGNYESCIALPKNTSQYCLFSGSVELLPLYIGVCYPSSDVCSPNDILGLMEQYSILSLLQFKMNFTAAENLHCYNQDVQTVPIPATTGTWVMVGISGFILLNVLIGTVIEYVFIVKFTQYRKRFTGLINNPYSLLNPKSYFETNSTNFQDRSRSNTITGKSVNNNQEETDELSSGDEDIDQNEIPWFYNLIFDRLDQEQVEEHWFVKYILCWSLIRNCKSLVYGSSSKQYFNSLDGIRTLSTCWVILGHTLLFGVSGFGFDNLMYLVTGPVIKTFAFQVIPAGEFAVDTFFMLSGFLVSYSVIGAMNKFKNDSNKIYGSVKFWFLYVVHRFIRLSPLYYFIIFFSMWVIPMWGSGPIFYEYQQFTQSSCNSNWWTNLLYINNLYSLMGNECTPWTWYLSNDMQFFLLTPFIIVFYRKWKLGAWVLVLSMISASIIGTTIAASKNSIAPFFDFLSSADAVLSGSSSESPVSPMITDIYQKPWYRIGPYLVGILVSFIYCAPGLSKKVRFAFHKRPIRYVLYGIALFITFFLSYIPYNFYQTTNGWTNIQNSVFSGFAHTFFTIGLAVFMIGTFYGYGGFVKSFLELPVFKIFSKLTYSAYLVHPLVILYRLYSMSTFLHYSTIEFSILYIGNIITTFAIASLIHLIIEKPFINLERLLFSK